jgi:hypothetical protein
MTGQGQILARFLHNKSKPPPLLPLSLFEGIAFEAISRIKGEGNNSQYPSS